MLDWLLAFRDHKASVAGLPLRLPVAPFEGLLIIQCIAAWLDVDPCAFPAINRCPAAGKQTAALEGVKNMLWIALAVLAIAAAGGLTLAVAVFRRRPFPASVGYLHGAVGLSGVVLLAIAVFARSQGMPVNTALLLFSIAVVGGLFVLLFRLQREPPPVFMVILHGGMALAGLALLLIGLLG